MKQKQVINLHRRLLASGIQARLALPQGRLTKPLKR